MADYGPDHWALRERWRLEVEAGRAICCATRCLEPSRRIQPGDPWDLGHTADRTGWVGPCHPSCNRVEGSRRGNAIRWGKPVPPERWAPTQRW